MTAPTWHAVVIGVGNPYRRDDGVGPAVIDRLRDRAPAAVRLDESDGEPSQLLELWSGADLAIVVDAVRTADGRPGRVHQRCRPGGAGGIPGQLPRVDLGDAVALALAVDRMPATLVLYGIEVADIRSGRDSPRPSRRPPTPLRWRSSTGYGTRRESVMCLSEAARVLDIDGDSAVVELRGAIRTVALVVLTFAGETVRPGDWLLMHTGLAVARISAGEAAEINAIRDQGEAHA